jgi:hypothetical protein
MSSICQSHKEKTDLSRLFLVEFDFREWQSGIWAVTVLIVILCWNVNSECLCVRTAAFHSWNQIADLLSSSWQYLTWKHKWFWIWRKFFFCYRIGSVAMSFSWDDHTMLHLVLFCCTLMWSDVLTWISTDYLIVTRNGDSKIGHTCSMFSTLTQELSSFSTITMHISQPWYFSVRSKQDYSNCPHPNAHMLL